MTDDRKPQPSNDEHSAQIIDLPAVTPPVRKLLAWFDELMADGDPPIGGLDAAVKELKALPHVPGRLGRDIDLLARGGAGAPRAEVVATLNRLRHIAAMDPQPIERSPKQHSSGVRRRPRRKPQPPQATLPGLAAK